MTITSLPLATPGTTSSSPAAGQPRPGHADHADRHDRFDALVEGHLAADQDGNDKATGTSRHDHDAKKKPTGAKAQRPATKDDAGKADAAAAGQAVAPAVLTAAVPAVVPAAVAVTGPAAATANTTPVAGPVPTTGSAPTALPAAPTPAEQPDQATPTPATQTPATPGSATGGWIAGVAARLGMPVTRPVALAGKPATTATANPAPVAGTTGPATGGQGVPGTDVKQQPVAVPEPATTPTTAPSTAPGTPSAGQPAGATDDKAGTQTKHAAAPEPTASSAQLPDPGTNVATSTSTVAPTATQVAAAATTPTQNAGAQATAVLDQVLPTLPRMVSRGDGTQSLTLKLHPADLGEVHLTVTVKNGTVDVTLAAGAAARDALRDGAGQLRSILDVTGHTAGQLVIRDLPTSSAATPAGAPTDGSLTGQTFADAGGSRGQQPDAGQQGRGATPQTGPRPDPAGRAVPEPRSTTSTRAGNRALDVRI